MAQNKYPHCKREGWEGNRKDQTKARSKPSRTNNAFCSSSTWCCDVHSNGIGSPTPMALLVAAHMASLLAGSDHYLQLYLANVLHSWHIQLPGVFIASLASLILLHAKPSQVLPSGIMALLHIVWPHRPSFEIWVEASTTP
jgi:hypothetical protein